MKLGNVIAQVYIHVQNVAALIYTNIVKFVAYFHSLQIFPQKKGVTQGVINTTMAFSATQIQVGNKYYIETQVCAFRKIYQVFLTYLCVLKNNFLFQISWFLILIRDTIYHAHNTYNFFVIDNLKLNCKSDKPDVTFLTNEATKCV